MVGKWDGAHLLSLRSLVISLKGIIVTAGRDAGPHLACERLSSTLQLLQDDVTEPEGPVSLKW